MGRIEEIRRKRILDDSMFEIGLISKFELGNHYEGYRVVNYICKRHGITNEKMYDGKGVEQVGIDSDMDAHRKKIGEQVYKKPWKRVSKLHKTLKIREFVAQLPYPDGISSRRINSNRKMLAQKLTEGLNNQRYVAKKSVITYCQEEMQIQSISCLVVEKGLYKIDWTL